MDYTSNNIFQSHGVSYPSGKRVAVLLSGDIRKGYELCLSSQMRNLIRPLKADVFFSFDDKLDQTNRANVLKILQPKEHIWCNAKLYTMPDTAGLLQPATQLMWKRIHDCNRLKIQSEQGFKYDIVIRIRPDLLIKEPVPLNIIKDIKPGVFYYPATTKLDILTSNSVIGITDQMGIGDSTTMDLYSNVYKYIYSDYLHKLRTKVLHCPASESILKYYLSKQKIKTRKYYQKFILYNRRLDLNNAYNAISTWITKGAYYPGGKCFYQNNFLS